jgi:Zn-dependent M28 family amino/carboxypeptidase
MNVAMRNRASAALLSILFGSGLAAQPAAPPEPLADLARLDKPTNAGRLAALREILTERGLAFEVQTFAGGKKDAPAEGANVVLGSSSGSAGAREIVVGAHYDAVMLKDGTLSHGMVDNGASVVVLLRVAEALKGRKLAHPVRIVFFDQEEIGLLGSKSFVAGRKAETIAAAINLDIAGYGDTLVFGELAGERNLPVYRAVRRVCAGRDLACLGFATFPPSDDRSFEAAGIPNVSLAFLGRAEAHQLWLLMNGGPDSGLRQDLRPRIFGTIHTPQDTLDKIDPKTLDLAAGVVLDTLQELDAALVAKAETPKERME